MPCERTLWQ